MEKQKVRKSIFGPNIDNRCLGYSWLGKFRVFIVASADATENADYEVRC
jgi:hypothetical protein